MGYEHYFHVLSAANYMKYVRPRLLKYYGVVDFRAIVREQIKRKQTYARIKSSFGLQSYAFADRTLENKGLFLKKFSFSAESRPFKGQKIKQEPSIENLIQGDSVFSQYQKNPFILFDSYMKTIDSFGGGSYKVMNSLQVENYINYMKVVESALDWFNYECEQRQDRLPISAEDQRKAKQGHIKSSVYPVEDDYDNDQKLPFDTYTDQEIKEVRNIADQYRGVKDAKEMFQEAYNVMKAQKKEEMLLVLRTPF